jgi:hypothetical protein
MTTDLFSRDFPGHQAALDIYSDGWFTAMPKGSGLRAGAIDNFSTGRVLWGAEKIGGLAGKTILELGPFEAHDTYQLEALGPACIVAIENNRDNFLKCLIVKNILGLRSTFLHGDMLRYLHEADVRYDVCWASGVLYHMTNPLGLLQGLAKISNTIYMWTHYVHPDRKNDPTVAKFFDPDSDRFFEFGGKSIRLHHRNYNYTPDARYSGGQDSYSYWMTKEDIFHILDALGFSSIEMGVDSPNHPPGAAFFFLARKSTS